MAGIRNSLHVETQPRQDNQADLNRTVLSAPSREYGSKPYACGLFLTTPSVVVLRPTLLRCHPPQVSLIDSISSLMFTSFNSATRLFAGNTTSIPLKSLSE